MTSDNGFKGFHMFTKRTALSVLAIALVGGIAACDSDDASDATGTGGTTAMGGSTGTGGTPGAGGTPAATGGTPGMGGAAPAGGTGGVVAPKDIVDIAAGNPAFSSLVAAVTKAELVTTLKGTGPFTVFAPTNDAFAALLTALNTNLGALTKEALTPILTYHVVAGKVLAADVVKLKVAKTVNGSDIRIRVDGAKVFLAGGNGADIEVTMTDIQASNGVIHVINKVLLPPKDIVDVAVDAKFNTLAAALTAAGLVDTLKGPGPFTVLAPTDAAFAKLPPATLADLLKPENKAKLADILKYHVIPGKVYSETVVTLTKATTVQGKDVTIAVAGGVVTLNGSSKVTATDVLASNGVIHVIDTVILPPAP